MFAFECGELRGIDRRFLASLRGIGLKQSSQ
jgi:hypothetical protein